jgi:peptidoglycan/xylan/chitin deacetylase (PgdA/CDA1 family)
VSGGTVLAAGGAVVAGGAAAFGAAEVLTYAARRREIAALRARCRRAGVLALTYDDGPGPALTPQLLEVLRRHDVKATFFALGRRAQVAPEVLDAVADEGHEIGCHTLMHHNAWKVAPWRALADLDAGYDVLARWVPADGRFRPPHGKQTTVTRAALRGRGAPVAWWTIDSGDTFAELPDPGLVVARVREDGGAVVLLHDHSDERPPERIEFVLEVTERLLHGAREDGLAVRPLRDV